MECREIPVSTEQLAHPVLPVKMANPVARGHLACLDPQEIQGKMARPALEGTMEPMDRMAHPARRVRQANLDHLARPDKMVHLDKTVSPARLDRLDQLDPRVLKVNAGLRVFPVTPDRRVTRVRTV